MTLAPSKQKFEEISYPSYAKYGVLHGVLMSNFENPSSPICGVILGGGWPAWVQIGAERSWTVMCVIIKAQTWTRIIQKLPPRATILLYDQCVGNVIMDMPVTVSLSDIDPPRRLKIYQCNQCELLITSQKAINVPEEWSKQTYHLADVDCGGHIDGQWHFLSTNLWAEACPWP